MKVCGRAGIGECQGGGNNNLINYANAWAKQNGSTNPVIRVMGVWWRAKIIARSQFRVGEPVIDRVCAHQTSLATVPF